MDIIHLLPENVANQIAAGEVIQRPASIIKELMENAIDAGASKIDVLLEESGRSLVQVIDNGKGMSQADAQLSFKHHATSKIRSAEDLFTLRTMGFRGEALPSIAAVAQVTLQTRTPDSELGTHVEIAGSAIQDVSSCVCPVGTNFEVRNLFYNTPARRKFLKSNQTELKNIIQEFERVALVNHSVEFTLTNGTQQTTHLTSTGRRGRIVDMFGKKIGEQLLQVDADTSLLHISGYVGRPETSHKKGVQQYFFVNGRYMSHPYFRKAVQKAYEGLIPADEQIPYFLFFDVDPASIDVNISPTKTEVKFQDEKAMWPIIIAAVKESLGKFNAIPTLSFDAANSIDTIPVYEKDKNRAAPKVSIDTDYNPFRNTTSRDKDYRPRYDNTVWQDLYSDLSLKLKETATVNTDERLFADEPPSIPQISTHTLQYMGQYIIVPCDQGLMIVNQNRAHMRVLYEKYISAMKASKPASQGLLFPDLLQLGLAESQVMDAMLDNLRQLGFDIEPLGGGSYSINSVPSDTQGLDTPTLVREIIQDIQNDSRTTIPDYRNHIVLTMARRSSITVGQALTPEESVALLTELFQCTNPNHTPDGKRIHTTIAHENIEAMLG